MIRMFGDLMCVSARARVRDCSARLRPSVVLLNSFYIM